MKTSLRQISQDLRHPYQRALLLIALVPLFPEYVSFLMVIAAAFFAYKDIKQTKQVIAIGTIGKLILAYIAYMVFTLIYSEDRFITLCAIGMWLFFFLVYLILYNLLTDTDRFDSIMLYITGVAGAMGLIACLQYRICYFTGENHIELWGWLDEIVFPYIPLDLNTPEYYMRACGAFTNPNSLSMYLTAVTPFVIFFNFYERREGLRLFCRVCLFLCFGGVVFSFCRGGYLAILVLAAALVLLNIRHRFATVSLYAICSSLLLPDEVIKRFLTIIPGVSIGEQILKNTVSSAPPADVVAGSKPVDVITTAEIINNSGADFAVSDRYRMWSVSVESFMDKPLFGHGVGTGISQDILEEAGITAPHTHNIILELLVGGGIIALILMAIIGIKAAKNGIELMRKGYGTHAFWIGFAVLGFVATFCVQGMVDYPLLTPKLVCNFMMIIAFIERAHVLYEAKEIRFRKNPSRASKLYRKEKAEAIR